MPMVSFDQIPLVIDRVHRQLEEAGDRRAAGAAGLSGALEDFVCGREGVSHAPDLARALSDESALFDLIEAAAAASSHGGGTGGAYHLAAHRLLDLEQAILRRRARRQAQRPRFNAADWAW